MAPKKYTYKHKVQLCPRSHGDILKDDPTESKNVIIPVEPESWKYGVYFNDGYDYNQHLISLDEFHDTNQELPQIDFNKRVDMHPSVITKPATVLNEYDVSDEYNILEDFNIEIEKEHDVVAIGKLKGVAKTDLDEDLLFALNNPEEFDQFSGDEEHHDNFIHLADRLPNTSKIDKDVLNRFFEDEDDFPMDDSSREESDDGLNFDGDMIGTLNAISQKHRAGAKDTDKLTLSVNDSSKFSIGSLSMLSMISKMNEHRAAKTQPEIKAPLEDLKRCMIYDIEEYDEEEVDQAVDEWVSTERRSAMEAEPSTKKNVKKHMSTLMVVPKLTGKKRRKVESMETDDTEEMSAPEYRINIAEYHMPRKGETNDEKKARKKGIKMAKRCRQEEKKEMREAFKALAK